jgi:cytochrome c biogenesis protein
MKLKIFRAFAQLNIAIMLLLVIAGFSIIGTIIEQDQSNEYYIDNYSNIFILGNIEFSKLILVTGFDHVYKTWWFLSLLLLFGTCLISCTYSQQFPGLKLARKCNFRYTLTEYKKQAYYTVIDEIFFFKCLENLKKRKYNIFQQKNYIYAYRGILGRFAPIIVHISMILILTGNTIAAFGSFNAQELMAKGEIFQIQNVVAKSYFTTIPDEPIRINDFWVNYGEKNNITQFYSDISILNKNGNEIKRKTISVNYPLQYKNLTFYQSDWNISGLRIKLNQIQYQLPVISLTKAKNVWICWIPNSGTEKNGITFITNNLNGAFSLYESSGKFIGTFNIGDKIGDLNILEYISETGIQIKADPGIPLIYFGFGLLIISSLISYFSFTQFWFGKIENKLLVGASANRAKLNLRLEFLALTLSYNSKKEYR